MKEIRGKGTEREGIHKLRRRSGIDLVMTSSMKILMMKTKTSIKVMIVEDMVRRILDITDNLNRK